MPQRKIQHIKPVSEALSKIDNRFLLTVVTARRWESITQGAPPLVPQSTGRHPIDVVLDEIIAERVGVDHENLEIVIQGEPEQEIHDEPLFSSAISPDEKNLDHLLGDEGK